jgi:hypothetical protein
LKENGEKKREPRREKGQEGNSKRLKTRKKGQQFTPNAHMNIPFYSLALSTLSLHFSFLPSFFSFLRQKGPRQLKRKSITGICESYFFEGTRADWQKRLPCRPAGYFSWANSFTLAHNSFESMT